MLARGWPILILIAMPLASHALQPMPERVPCVEVVADYFSFIYVGRIVALIPAQSTEIDVQIDEVLKGNPAGKGQTITLHLGDPAQWTTCQSRGGKVLVCKGEPEWTQRMGMPFGYKRGIGQVGLKSVPAWTGSFEAVYDLTAIHDRVFTARLELLKHPDHVLAAFRAAVKNAPKPDAEPYRYIQLPFSALGRAENTSMSPILLLPADARIEEAQHKLAHSPDPDHRLTAISIARRYAGDALRSREMVINLLADPAYTVHASHLWEPQIDKRATRHHPVRAAALDFLAPHSPPHPIDTPHFIYAPPRQTLIIIAAVLALATIIMIAVRSKTHRISRALAATSFILLIATILLWRHSHRQTHALTFSTGQTEHEITASRGRLAWLRVQSTPAPRPLLIRHEPRDLETAPWYAPLLVPAADNTTLGVRVARGVTAGGSAEPTFAYRLLDMRIHLLAVVFSLFPALLLASACFTRIRASTRRRQGRCPHCGYSLQGLATPVCPECGLRSS